MNFLYRLFRARGRTTGFETLDRTRTNSIVVCTAPEPERKELDEGGRLEIISQCRYHYRNNGLIREMVQTISLYAVGAGIMAQPASVNQEWNRKAAKLWKEWCRNPEITNRFTMRELQDIACRSIDTDGEFFIIKITLPDGSPKIELFESQNVGGMMTLNHGKRGFIHGIQLDAYGSPIAYSMKTAEEKRVTVPASSIIHVANLQRASSLRGIPAMQHTVGPASDIDTLLFLEKTKARAQADIIRVMKRQEHDEEQMGPVTVRTEPQEGDAEKEKACARITDVIGGKTIALDAGDDLENLTTNTPGAAFLDFITVLSRYACQGSGMPYEVVADPSKVGGASTRLVVSKAARYISNRQDLLIEKMMRPVYQHWAACMIAAGKLDPVDGWENVEWMIPGSITVDNGRDEAAERENVRAGLMPLQDYYAARGLDFSDEMYRRAEDVKLVMDLAKRAGVDPSVMLDIFANTAGMSQPAILEATGQEEPQISQMATDKETQMDSRKTE
ncbi:phage portal protein [Akkermansia glycaniphila]|uniref:phage portal protein n=1 Tax=Akkermansia glycaniphila TaxID=1679444 RepID=UPI001C02BD8A|nr:phage portal protein [Akkermansia glycaniphila]MBT9448761.1 phage portal protein [Akkermansia glycaniphila]